MNTAFQIFKYIYAVSAILGAIFFIYITLRDWLTKSINKAIRNIGFETVAELKNKILCTFISLKGKPYRRLLPVIKGQYIQKGKELYFILPEYSPTYKENNPIPLEILNREKGKI